MSKMANQYKKFMKELEDNIENKDDYNRIQSQISKLFMLFFSEMDEMKEMYEKKIDVILERQSKFNEKINKIESILDNIQRDIYMDDMEDNGSFEIYCPYCDKEFVTQMDEIEDEIECPNCGNIIELDWDECDGECSGGCHGHNISDDDDEDNKGRQKGK